MYKVVVNLFIISVASLLNVTLVKWFASYEVIAVNGAIFAASLISIASALFIFVLVSPRTVRRTINFNIGMPHCEHEEVELGANPEPVVDQKKAQETCDEVGRKMYEADKNAGKTARKPSKKRSESAKKRPRDKNGRWK